MFDHLIQTDIAHVEREAPAKLAARFTTDAVIIRDAMIRAVSGIGDVVTVVGLIISMVYMDWELSLIAAVLYPIAAVPLQRLGKRVRRASSGMQERVGETAAFLTESFAQARTVRVYRLEESEGARAALSFNHLYQAMLRITRGRARWNPCWKRWVVWPWPQCWALLAGGLPWVGPRWGIFPALWRLCCWPRARCVPLARLMPPCRKGWPGWCAYLPWWMTHQP